MTKGLAVMRGSTHLSEPSSAAAAKSPSRIALQTHADCPETGKAVTSLLSELNIKWLLIFCP